MFLIFATLAPPSPPQNLSATSVTSKSVTIRWEPPLSNGGSDLTGYVVEKRLATLSSSIKWTRVVTLDAYCTQYCIDNLKEKSEYVFRVLAENEAGLSAPATTESIVLKTHASKKDNSTNTFEFPLFRCCFSRSITNIGNLSFSLKFSGSITPNCTA